MRAKGLAALAVTFAVTVGAYWYWSPVFALRQMQSAAKAGDADAFNDHVDYPRLRESLKGQLSAVFTDKLASQPTSGNEFAKAGAALGTMLGLAMVDKMVDAFVRPEAVMRAMQEGKLMPKTAPDAEPSGRTSGGNELTWQSERKGVDKYLAHVSKVGEPEDQRISLVLERSGFARWKLTEVRLPALQ